MTFSNKNKLVGGWTNPSVKYESNWESSSGRGENKRYLKKTTQVIMQYILGKSSLYNPLIRSALTIDLAKWNKISPLMRSFHQPRFAWNSRDPISLSSGLLFPSSRWWHKEPTTLMFRGYNPYFWGFKPSCFHGFGVRECIYYTSI